MNSIKITGEQVRNALNFTDYVVKSCGKRLVGSEGDKKAMLMLKEEYSKHCDEGSMKIEEFECHPNSFLGYIKISVLLYILASILLFFYPKLVIISFIGYFFAFFMFLSQFLLYWEVFDLFFKKKRGFNVYGSIEPEKEVKQRIIISGHHDAPYTFTFIQNKCELYGILIIAALIPLVIGLLMSLIWWILLIVNGTNPKFALFIQIFQLCGIATIIPMSVFITKKVSPGAGDNIIACAMGIEIAKTFGNAKKKNTNLLKHTQLTFISFDAEESGLRGARAYVKRHYDELHAISTYDFNIDGIYELKNMKFFNRDINMTRSLSDELAKECQGIAKDLGYDLPVIGLPIGGGGTDAAEFSKRGIKSTTLIALATNIIRHNLVYHTSDDNVNRIEPKAVEVGLQIAVNFIKKKEDELSDLI